MKSVQPVPSSVTPRPTTTVLLIRHGETDTIRTRLAGRLPRVDLNVNGARQAADLGRRLARSALTAIYTSPLLRARATANALAAQLNVGVQIDEDLMEIDFGEWTGLTFDELSARDDWRSYNADRCAATIPGGEAPDASAARVARALRRYHNRHPGETIGAVTHAELIRYAILGARQLPLAQWADIDVPPGSISVLNCGALNICESPGRFERPPQNR